MNTPEEILAVVNAFVAGKPIQYRSTPEGPWLPAKSPTWNFPLLKYRIQPEYKPQPKDYRQVKYKRKDKQYATTSVNCYLSLHDFYTQNHTKEENFEFCELM